MISFNQYDFTIKSFHNGTPLANWSPSKVTKVKNNPVLRNLIVPIGNKRLVHFLNGVERTLTELHDIRMVKV